MGTGSNGESESENSGGGLLDCSSLGNIVSLPSDKVLGMTVGAGLNSPLSGGWTPLYSVPHNEGIITSPISSYGQIYNSSYTDLLQSQGTSRITRFVQFQSDSSLAELEHKHPCFGSGSFSDMDSLFRLHRCNWIANSAFSTDYPREESGNKIEKALTSQISDDNYVHSQEECKILDVGTTKPLPDLKKREGECDDGTKFVESKNMKTEKEKDQCTGEENEEKPITDQKPAANTCCHDVSKRVKDSSTKGDAPKEDYVHVRAKRGHATNSHSLAERVRREKIRERMKFLQDIVPGCNKITGKAVMLDEIINYVLSLQRQVEFLSMKLATVCPETSVEPVQILSRDIHHSQDGSAAVLGDPEMNSYSKEILRGALLTTQTTNLESLYSPTMPNVTSIWENEFHNTNQMDFISDLTTDNPKSNG